MRKRKAIDRFKEACQESVESIFVLSTYTSNSFDHTWNNLSEPILPSAESWIQNLI